MDKENLAGCELIVWINCNMDFELVIAKKKTSIVIGFYSY